MKLLEVRDVTAGYDGLEVLHGIDLDVDEGETVCVLGANGAGKSTILRTIMCQVKPTAGVIRFQGRDLRGAKRSLPAHIGIGYVPEGRGILASLTVRENLEMGAYPPRAQPDFAANFARTLNLFPALVQKLHHRAADLSGGQQQMVAIGRALMSSPKLIILDEPSLGLAPQIVSQVYAVLTALKAAGHAILLIEQAVGKALLLSDRATVIEAGRVVLAGSSAQVKADRLLRDAYLGL